MENASKALIIAGAIILAVLIIGLGMGIFMTANNSSDPGTELDEYQQTQFNSKFMSYMGSSVRGTKVMSLCDVVRQHNSNNREDPTRQILIEIGDDFTDDEVYEGEAKADDGDEKLASAAAAKKEIRSGKTYSVTYQQDKYSGLICAIHIRDLAG